MAVTMFALYLALSVATMGVVLTAAWQHSREQPDDEQDHDLYSNPKTCCPTFQCTCGYKV